MEFYINGNKTDVTLENETSLGDVFNAFRRICKENDAVITDIAVNGEAIAAERYDSEAEKALTQDVKIEFGVITKPELLASFKELATRFRELLAQLSEVPVAIQSGKVADVSKAIVSLADAIGAFCRLVPLLVMFDEYAAIHIADKSIDDFFADFSPVLADFESALRSNDTVSMQDLSEYEIVPRLEALAETVEGLI